MTILFLYSPTQVLTRPDPAYLLRSKKITYIKDSVAIVYILMYMKNGVMSQTDFIFQETSLKFPVVIIIFFYILHL